MEKEKYQNKNISENLLRTIDELQEQKKLLSKRLEMAKQNAFTVASANNVKDLLKNNKNGELLWDYCHLSSVGILYVKYLKIFYVNFLLLDSYK